MNRQTIKGFVSGALAGFGFIVGWNAIVHNQWTRISEFGPREVVIVVIVATASALIERAHGKLSR